MADKETLRSMLNNFINDKHEEATLDLHNYLSSKMREVAGFGNPIEVTPTEVELDPTNPVETE